MAEDITKQTEEQPEEIDFDLENELMLIKMQAEFGAQVYLPDEDNDSLPAEVKYELLQSVYEFEEAYFQAMPSVVDVYTKLGAPRFLNETCLTDEGIVIELKRMVDMMSNCSIIFEHEYDYEPRRLYKFITEELFNEQMEDLSIPGFYKHFFYEDFHPNISEELKRQSRRFLEEVAGQCLDELYNGLNFQVKSKDGIINGDEACNRIREYYDRFDSIRLESMDNFLVLIEDKQATVCFDVSLNVSIPLNENITLEGKATLGFANVMSDLWLIDSVTLPGLVL